MNKKIIFFAALIVVIVGAAWATLYYISQHIAIIKLTDQNTPMILVQNANTKDSQQVAKFSKDSKLRLNQGSYCVFPTDSSNYDTSNGTCFEVKNKDVSVTVTPDYSKNKLHDLLSGELSNIKSVINTRYAPIINNYRLADGVLYSRGQWYGSTLTEVTPPSERGDVYRVILEKVNSSWQIVARPALVLNKYDYPKIPHSVLDAVNKLDGTY